MKEGNTLYLARDIIGQLEAEADTEFLDHPHVVLVRDPMVGTMPKTVIGPFPSVIEALEYAGRVQKDIRTNWVGADPQPEVSVAPIMPPEANPNVMTA